MSYLAAARGGICVTIVSVALLLSRVAPTSAIAVPEPEELSERLSGIARDSLSAMIDVVLQRAPFSEPLSEQEAEPVEPVAAVLPTPPQLPIPERAVTLTGVVLGRVPSAVFLGLGDGDAVKLLRIGESAGGIQLLSVDRESALVTANGHQLTFVLGKTVRVS